MLEIIELINPLDEVSDQLERKLKVYRERNHALYISGEGDNMMIRLYSIKPRKILKEETRYHLLNREIRLALSPDQLFCLINDKSKFRIT